MPINGLVSRRVHTAPSTRHRTITISYANGLDERYALFRFADGDVGWRLDEFRFTADPREAAHWSDSHGRLTVAEVVARLPEHARIVHDWTRREIELGTVVVDDIFSAMRRDEAVARLTAELDESEAASSRQAG